MMNPAPLFRTWAALLAAIASTSGVPAPSWAADFDFAHRVVPILQKHCAECHGGHRKEGEFSINTRESILDSGSVELGEAEASYFFELVTTDDPEMRMPKEKPALSDEEVQTLREWIDARLPWESGFSFAPNNYEPPLAPRRPELPPVVDGRENPVDRILDAYLAEHGGERPAPLEDAAFMRRVYLDVVGLLPPVEELAKFVASEEPLKRERLVDALLADNRGYTEHWLTFWNDLLRNDYKGTGYIEGGRKQISAWLYRALEQNMPFDEFVRQLIAPTPESEGFIYGITWRGNVNASQKREVQFAQNISQVFLGINMKCASCHDSFIDRWTLAETYGLAAVTAEAPLEMYRCDKPTGKMAEAAWMFPALGQIDAKAPREERLKQLALLMTHPENGRLTRTIVNRLWHRLMGRGIVQPVDAMQTAPWSADLLDYLAVYLVDNKYDLKRVLRLILTSQAYQSQAVTIEAPVADADFVYAGPIAKRMTAEQFVDALWALTATGPKKPHEKVAEFLSDEEETSHTSYRASLVNSDLLMRSLGRPNREQVVTDRPAVLTTLQALDLANNPGFAKALARGARHQSARFSGEEPRAVVEWLYAAGLSRPPTAEELEVALAVLGSPASPQGLEDLMWMVLMLPEFQIVR